MGAYHGKFAPLKNLSDITERLSDDNVNNAARYCISGDSKVFSNDVGQGICQKPFDYY